MTETMIVRIDGKDERREVVSREPEYPFCDGLHIFTRPVPFTLPGERVEWMLTGECYIFPCKFDEERKTT